MTNENSGIGKVEDDENPLPALLNAKILEVMKKEERARQTPVYDLFVKYGFKEEADRLYSNGKNTVGRFIAILDSSPVNRMFYTSAGLDVYDFLNEISLSKDRDKVERGEQLFVELNKTVALSKLIKDSMSSLTGIFKIK